MDLIFKRKLRKQGIAFILATAFVISLSIIVQVNSTKEMAPKDFNMSDENKSQLVLPDNLQPVNIIIKEGDTAWSIQKSLTPEKDVKKVLHELAIINQKDMETLTPGEVLQFAK